MKLGIVTIQRNRAPWIKEWIAFHYLVGFRKFYIFLHKCSDDTEKILTKLKKKFDITILTVDPNLENPQFKCYQNAYENFGSKVDWMAFIDGDEFLFPTKDNSMEIALKKYSDKKISALGVYWSCFGSSGHIREPNGLIIENYKYRAFYNFAGNRHIKSIVRKGQKSIIFNNPHLFQTPLGTYDENLRIITNSLTDYKPTYRDFCINHYTCQSLSFFLNFKGKFPTPDGSGIPSKSLWKEYDRNDVFDNSMNKFIKPLKNILNFTLD